MTLLKKNITANFAGNIGQALMAVVFVPLYIKFMGVESYGLVGIFITLLAMFSILDMGMSSTLNREMARLSVLPGRDQEMRNLVRTLELPYWLMAIFVGIAVMALSPLIAHSWVQAGQLHPEIIEKAIFFMGISVAFQMPASLYSGGLLGLQQQVLLNVINLSLSTLRGVGAVLVLWLISPTIQAFFLWQIIISSVNSVLLGFFLWRRLPRSEDRPVFQKRLFLGIWRFAAGMAGISILSTLLTQLDKIILSKMLPLEIFGYYTLAGVVAMSLYRLVSPVFSAIYPRFTQLVSRGDQDGLRQLYHKSSQFLSVLIFPVTLVVAMFSYDILLIWTQNPTTAEKAHLLVTVLICGTALHGLMHIPYALQLASGWTQLTFFTNLVAVLVLVPVIIYLANQYGALGGASAWVILNCGYVLVITSFMHRRLLPNEKWRWCRDDVALPFAASFAVAGLGRILMGVHNSQITTILLLLVISFSTLVITALATQTTRIWLVNKLTSTRSA